MKRACVLAWLLVGLPAAARAADDPAVDLLTSRHLFHLEPGPGRLLIPVATEGVRKYAREYSNPWGAAADIDGHPGRRLSAKAATLEFPLFADPADTTVLLRVRAAGAGQKLTVNLNGRPLKNTALTPGWQVVTAVAGKGQLKKGENRLFLAAARPGLVVHSIEIAPVSSPSPDPNQPWPTLDPGGRGPAGAAALSSAIPLTMLLEVPKQARLRADTAGAARFTVTLRKETGETATLLDERRPDGPATPHDIDLGPWAGTLVALSLATPDRADAGAVWLRPRIELATTAPRPRPAPVDNAIIFIGDALRADRIGLYDAIYGKTRVRTPRIKTAAEAGGVWFLHGQAASPSSPPSHASIQSGSTPRTHGVGGDKGKLVPGAPLLSAVLGKAGVATGYFGNNPFGMNRLRDAGRWKEFHNLGNEGKSTDCAPLVKEMLAFAKREAEAGRRFFISSIAFEPHTPYLYRQGITEHYFNGPWDDTIGRSPDGRILYPITTGKFAMNADRWAQLKGLYDGEVEYMDGCFGALLDGLDKLGLRGKTAVLLTADHGEGFLEHGGMGHAFGHWFEVTSVPFLFLAPGLAPKGVALDAVASHLDIAPTILDLLGLPADERMQGESLLPAMLSTGATPTRMVPSEYGRSYGLRSAGFRYIVDYGGTEMVYDLTADPTEKKDVKDARPFAVRYLRDRAGFYLAHRSAWRMKTWGDFAQHRRGFGQGATPTAP